MSAMEKNLWDTAEKRLRENIIVVDSLDEIVVSDNEETASGIYSMPWCGSEECAHAIEDRTGFGLLGVPSERGNPEYAGSHDGRKCAVCGRDAISMVMAARSM
jgi:prolyl-tRNA synthetase